MLDLTRLLGPGGARAPIAENLLNLRSVAYAPFYLAIAADEFEAAGVNAEFITSPHPSETAAGLLAGRMDVS